MLDGLFCPEVLCFRAFLFRFQCGFGQLRCPKPCAKKVYGYAVESFEKQFLAAPFPQAWPVDGAFDPGGRPGLMAGSHRVGGIPTLYPAWARPGLAALAARPGRWQPAEQCLGHPPGSPARTAPGQQPGYRPGVPAGQISPGRAPAGALPGRQPGHPDRRHRPPAGDLVRPRHGFQGPHLRPDRFFSGAG